MQTSLAKLIIELQMLQNEKILANIGFDTAENEPSKIRRNLANSPTIADCYLTQGARRYATTSAPRARPST